MKTIEQGIDWLMNRKPDFGFVTFIIACVVWTTVTVMNFDGRLRSVESQLPELRHEMNARFNEVDRKFDKVDQRLDKIDTELVDMKLTLKKIETYLETTNQNYKPQPK